MTLQSPNNPSLTGTGVSFTTLAFRGLNSFLNVVLYGPPEVSYGSLYTSPTETALYALGIASLTSGGVTRLFVAWKSDKNDDISLAELTLTYDQAVPRVTNLTKKGGTLFSVAARGPAIAFLGTELWMAYTATDFSIKYLSFGNLAGGADPLAGSIQTVPGASSYGGPTICGTNTRGLFIAWADNAGELKVYSQTANVTTPIVGQSCDGTSVNSGAALAYVPSANKLYAAWSDATQQVRILPEDQWAVSGASAVPLSSSAVPALTCTELSNGAMSLYLAAIDSNQNISVVHPAQLLLARPYLHSQ